MKISNFKSTKSTATVWHSLILQDKETRNELYAYYTNPE